LQTLTNQPVSGGPGRTLRGFRIVPDQGFVVMTKLLCQGRDAGRFSPSFRAQLVIDRENNEVALVPRGPFVCEGKQGEGVAAARDGDGKGTFGIGRKPRDQRVKISPKSHRA